MTTTVARSKPTGRVEKRKDEMIIKYSSAVGRFKYDYCLERAWLLTESHKKTEGKPMVIRKAEALAHILDNMTIYIRDGELIVGDSASKAESLCLYPEMGEEWLWDLMRTEIKPKVDEHDKRRVDEIIEYWEPRRIGTMIDAYMPEQLKEFFSKSERNMISTGYYTLAQGGTVPNYEKLFKVGLKGIIEEAENRLKCLRNSSFQGRDSSAVDDYYEGIDFLEAVITNCRAAIRFSRRYADHARKMTIDEPSPARKMELEKIAQICDWVPENPPRTFHEALQFFWFIHLITHHIEFAHQGISIRFDKIFAPFYENDKKNSLTTYEDALELVELLWIKIEETGILRCPKFMFVRNGSGYARYVTVGGLTENGDYLCNDLTFMALDATMAVRVVEPGITLRCHPKMPASILDASLDLIKTGHGMPALYSDNVAITQLLGNGVPLEVALDYSIECVGTRLPGKNRDMHYTWRPRLNLGRCLRLALFQGKATDTGAQEGYPTKDATRMTFDEIFDAYIQQVNYHMSHLSDMVKLMQPIYQRYLPLPFYSAFVDNAIERAKDSSRWAQYPRARIFAGGYVNTADSLATIKKIVFEDKVVSMEELLEALRTNWEGKEELRQKCLNVTKYGNDCDWVDSIARQVHQRTQAEVKKFTCYFGGPLTLEGSTGALWFSMGPKTEATPDGRKDGDIFADGTVSPMYGMDKKGPTAVLNSVSRIDQNDYTLLFNQKFMPQYLEGENRRGFKDYLRTWMDMGIYHAQFNVFDPDVLRDAQKHPGKHAGLVVRVAGYSAYFVDLSKKVQDGIIMRTSQRL